MNEQIAATDVEIFGKTYRIKCPASEVDSLKRAAEHLEEKMRALRDSGILSLDRVAIIAALNVLHQLQKIEDGKDDRLYGVHQRLLGLQDSIEKALSQHEQLEFETE